MSTSSDDTTATPDPTGSSDTSGSTDTADDSGTTTTDIPASGTSANAAGTSTANASDDFLSGKPTPTSAGLFGPETFGIAGFFLLATSLLTTQLVGIFNQQALTGAAGTLTTQVQGELTGAGLFSGLAVLFAAIALVRTNPTTRPWARHLAAATVMVGVLLVILTVVSYVMLSAP